MQNDIIEMLIKRISVLEKKLEQYYNLLKVNNEISFILNGTYIKQEDVDNFINGTMEG